MASILRSSKFVRYIAGFAKNIVVNTPREFDGSFINTTQCLCGAIPRSFANQAASVQQHEQGLDSCLRRLDQDVRRSGRISRRDIEDVLEEIRNARSATSSQSLLVIRCCGNLVPEELPEIRTKLVEEIWNTLKKLNVPMDVSHYNALLRVYLENEHEFSPTEFLSKLESKGIEPNRVTYQRLIAQYCQIGDIEGATRILEFMREKQLPVNENVFNALINGHSQTGDMDSARGILSVMSQAGLEPSADTYTTLICGFAKKGNLDQINEILTECESKEIYLLDKDYLDVCYALATNGFESELDVILSKTRKAFGYNQDAINVILRLINRGLDEAAFKILKTMPRNSKSDGTQQGTGSFYLKQLVKVERSFEEILSFCKRFEDEQLFENPLSYVTECSLELGKEKLAYKLLEEMKQKGIPIRQHYFWPLIVSKAHNGDEIIDVLHEMGRFNLNPSTETIREYVLPHLKGKSSDILSQLRMANVSIGAAACSLVNSLLYKRDIEEAALIMQRVSAYYAPEFIRKPLTAAFFKTGNVDALVTIIRHVYENVDRRSEAEDDTSTTDKSEIVGKFLSDLASYGRQFNDVAEQIFARMVSEGLSISTLTAERLQDKLGEKLTPEISTLLSQLSSGELIPVPVEKKEPAYTPSYQMNIPQLERLVQNLDAKKQDTRGLKRQLLTLYYRAKELEKMEQLYTDLESDPNFNYTEGVYAQLLDTCAYHEKFEETLKYLEKLTKCNPDFILDEAKVIRVVTVLVKNDRLDDALAFLKRSKDPRPGDRTFNYNSLCWRLMNYLADKGKVEELQKLFDALFQNEYLEINNVNLGPLVKVHLVNKDLDKALEKFEWCCNQFRATPWKNEMACKLIQAEDAEKLQKLTDLSTSVHGEINSLYDLVFAFVECGRIRQARKILETPGLQHKPQRLNVACQRYQQEGKVKPLEGLRDATKDLNHIDRYDIYYQLLLSYIKHDDVDKSLSLWTQMQEEDLAPTDEFLIKLGNLLRKHNMQIPFNMPERKQDLPKPKVKQLAVQSIVQQLIVQQHTVQQPTVQQQQSHKKENTLFRQVLKDGDVDRALQIKNTTTETLTNTDISLLIEKLVQNERQHEATDLAVDMLAKGATPMARVFRYLLNKLANTGDVEMIERIGAKLDAETKKVVSFDNRICHANLVAGRADEYLDKLEAEIDGAKDEDLAAIGEKFPRGGAVGILERHTEHLEQYERLAIKYAKRGIIAPVNVLWSHYFVNHNEAKASEMWTTYLQGAPRIMFQRVVQHARELNDEVLTDKLIEHLKTSKVTDGALGNAYSCLIDILVTKEKTDEAIAAFDNALQSVSIDYINRTAILRVKEFYEKLDKPFNYKIPPKHSKTQTSSSSSSDEEAKRK